MLTRPQICTLHERDVEMMHGGLTHAGGVVHRQGPNGVEHVLLVRASKAPFEWVLPKGHIEHGETPAETASREVLEETGVEASVGPELGTSSFVSPKGEEVRVLFFLMRFESSRAPKELRALQWCVIDDALVLTPFESNRVVLRAARDALTRMKTQ